MFTRDVGIKPRTSVRYNRALEQISTSTYVGYLRSCCGRCLSLAVYRRRLTDKAKKVSLKKGNPFKHRRSTFLAQGWKDRSSFPL